MARVSRGDADLWRGREKRQYIFTRTKTVPVLNNHEFILITEGEMRRVRLGSNEPPSTAIITQRLCTGTMTENGGIRYLLHQERKKGMQSRNVDG